MNDRSLPHTHDVRPPLPRTLRGELPRTHSLVQKLEQFTKLSEEERTVLEACVSRIENFDAEQDIVREGDRPDAVHLLLSGWAGRYKILDGVRHIMAYLIPGDLCDIQITLLTTMDHSIGTLSPCTVATIPRDRITSIIDTQKHLARALSWSTLVDEAILREWLVSLALRPAEARMAHLICEMLLRSRAVGLADGDSFQMPLTQIQLSQTLGLSAVHMNRTIQKLRNGGVISFEGVRMTVLDWKRLTAEARFDPTYLHRQTWKGARNPDA
jgi:CRP-like cAMP-binding protein